MNCPRCQYLLWELRDNRCPECALPFEATDYAFPPGAVNFVCPDCGESYLGNDERGLPEPRRFDCVSCGRLLAAASMPVRPIRDGVRGVPLRIGTPWEHRKHVGFIRGFVDGVSRLAIQPGEYFRQCQSGCLSGAAAFSVICAYGATVLLLLLLVLMGGLGPAGLLSSASWRVELLLFLFILVPVGQLMWNYCYGLLIQMVLFCLGRRGSETERSVHAVAYGSAVLPAMVLMPPLGLLWYVSVVASGVENLHGTSRGQALLATLIPFLVAANVLLAAYFTLA